MRKDVNQMSDLEVLAAVGDNGPLVVGKELFERAQRIRKRNPNGALGPSIVGTEPSERITVEKKSTPRGPAVKDQTKTPEGTPLAGDVTTKKTVAKKAAAKKTTRAGK